MGAWAMAWAWAAVAAGSAGDGRGITARVDRAQVAMGEHLTLTLVVDGGRGAVPVLPELPDFEVVGRAKSSQMTLSGGRMHSETQYRLELAPRRTGTLLIGAARIDIEGTVHHSAPIEVVVLADAPPPPPPPRADEASDRRMFLQAEVSNPRPWLGEPIVYTWRFYRLTEVHNAGLTLPNFAGFFSQNLGAQRDFHAKHGGEAYTVTEISYALVPQEAGELILQGTSLQCEVPAHGGRGGDAFGPFGGLFGHGRLQPATLRSPPLPVHVRALPSPQPAGFAGLVGAFDVEAALAHSALQVGDSTTLSVRVHGRGLVQGLLEPPWTPAPGLRAYDDKPQVEISPTGDGMVGGKTFRKALVATAPGRFEVGPFEVVFFDPETGDYRRAAAGPLTLAVTGPPAGAAPPAPAPAARGPKGHIEVLADDIQANVGDPSILGPRRPGRREARLLTAALTVPPAAWAAAAGSVALRRRRAGGGGRGRRGARRRAQEAAARVEAEVAAGRPLQAAELASRCLRQFLHDHSGIGGLAATPEDVAAALRGRGVEEGVVVAAHAFLARCEAARFGSAAGDAASPSGLGGALGDQLDQLAAALGGRR